MIKIKNKKEVDGIRRSCHLLAQSFQELQPLVKEGNTGIAINAWAENFATKYKATPSFRVHGGFPTAMCISVNHAVIHGIPTDKPFQTGDIVSIDFGLELNGYFSDKAISFIIGESSPSVKELIADTQEALMLGIKAINPENGRIQDIGKAISSFLRPKKYGIVHDFCGHGVGLAVHEDPQIAHDYPSFGPNPRFKDGMVLAIEPMVNLGTAEVYIDKKDKWTVYTQDGSLSAHFEHTIAIMDGKVEILTELP
ncbi:type I methionyl aminopeptidase [Entomospira entomophila]|uniref:Methionine aminopeptidase n=1 Tax=Entomospira entomophila TaxID=2719988 RepID=A0A968GCY7_9SPIO|nr:type I methionyl aminopeptidase [Entomospira entomophilus]NIZ40689.1 type I methionyl aminopeptidase [Entomospira entomophilus]WDI34902.1 type I methionyl aminopeptidase [Entomospira entomophilus]